MTDTQDEGNPTLDAEQSVDADLALQLDLHGPGNDWFLQKMVALANHGGLKFGITLAIEGQVITGELVSVAEYFKLYADSFVGPGSDSEIRSAIASLGAGPPAERDGEPVPPNYVHLRNARYVTAGGQRMPTTEGMLWRGKINAVSGWSLGSFDLRE